MHGSQRGNEEEEVEDHLGPFVIFRRRLRIPNFERGSVCP